CQQDYTTPWTF
nr:immunoglobulin light chain junction region [Macaca mulatta]MPN86722.1 immunoglobulin light chain junction region [Macaca mulatta]MPN86728.1 immunoglobulin light chain junction region [Macaca mulatta]MPN86729.1 immunoglobulin light chain junction region [Macaca mulatta]MPN86731.1 immunoglobulin light chain junction region [Macaca mulatta]